MTQFGDGQILVGQGEELVNILPTAAPRSLPPSPP